MLKMNRSCRWLSWRMLRALADRALSGRHSDDSIQDERPFLWRRITDGVRALEGFASPSEPLWSVGVQREQRLTHMYPHAGLGVQYDAGSRLHRMLLATPAGTPSPRGLAGTERVQGLQKTVPLSCDHFSLMRGRQRGVRIAALRADHGTPDVHRRPRSEQVSRVMIMPSDR